MGLRAQPIKGIILLLISMLIIERTFCAGQECSGPRPLHRGNGEGVQAQTDPVSQENYLEEVEPELSCKEPLCPGRLRAGSECEFRWQQ